MTLTIMADTLSGKSLDLWNPKVSQVAMLDIATSLSKQCRYNGGIRGFYSVAEHVVLMSQKARENGASPKRQALMLLHDFTETWLPDIPTPTKRHLFFIKPDGLEVIKFKDLETQIFATVSEATFPGLLVSLDDWKFLEEYDERIVKDEWLALRPHVPMSERLQSVEPLGVTIHGWEWIVAFEKLIWEYQCVVNLLRA
jgi:hypothetical protein